MYNPDTELLFPLRVAPALGAMRGRDWQLLTERIALAETSVLEQMAFVFMMVRMGGCIGCNADSFRAMKGCTLCARQSIKRYKGTDEELLELFEQTRKEIDIYLAKKSQTI